MARTRVWRKGVLEKEDFPIDAVSDYLAQPDCLVWADLRAPGPEQMQQLADELGLDPLAVEDAVENHERPKVDRYPQPSVRHHVRAGPHGRPDDAAVPGVGVRAGPGAGHGP